MGYSMYEAKAEEKRGEGCWDRTHLQQCRPHHSKVVAQSWSTQTSRRKTQRSSERRTPWPMSVHENRDTKFSTLRTFLPNEDFWAEWTRARQNVNSGNRRHVGRLIRLSLDGEVVDRLLRQAEMEAGPMLMFDGFDHMFNIGTLCTCHEWRAPNLEVLQLSRFASALVCKEHETLD